MDEAPSHPISPLRLSTLRGATPIAAPIGATGKIVAVNGTSLLAHLPAIAIGDLCFIRTSHGEDLPAQAIGFDGEKITLAPFGNIEGLSPGAAVRATGRELVVTLRSDPRGGIFDALGRSLQETPMDSRSLMLRLPIVHQPPPALTRRRITTPITTGVAAIDSCCTLGYGQRIGLFAPSGAGKSTLLGMIARNADVDVTVVGLIGERGREVGEFLEDSLGVEGLRRAAVVVATSDEPAIKRLTAVKTATAIAEYYRAQGKRVLLIIDSLTRTARALREIGLASGEIPVREGYPNSVYSELPRLLERAGNDAHGSITAVYTVLTHENGERDPLSDEIKSLLDGHLILDPALALQGIRPAIDITASISRLTAKLQTPAHASIAGHVRALLARLRRDRDLVLLGGAADPELRAALRVEHELAQALSQTPNETFTQEAAYARLKIVLEVYARELADPAA